MNAVELAVDDLPASASMDQVGAGIKVGHRQPFAVWGHGPGLFDFNEVFLGGHLALILGLSIVRLLDQAQVINRRLILRVLFEGLLELGFGFVELAGFQKHFSVLHQRHGFDLFLHDERQPAGNIFMGNMA